MISIKAKVKISEQKEDENQDGTIQRQFEICVNHVRGSGEPPCVNPQTSCSELRSEMCHCQGRKPKSHRGDHQRTEPRTRIERSHSQMVIVTHSNGEKRISYI